MVILRDGVLEVGGIINRATKNGGTGYELIPKVPR